jgi:hypothetical protein
MAKVFIGIAMLFMLATACVGFMLKGNVDKLQSAYGAAKGKIATAEGNARAAKSDAEKAQKEAKDANDKATAAEQTAQAKGKEADDAKMQLAEAKMVLEGKDKEIADLKAKSGPVDPTAPTKEQMAQKDAQIAEITAQKQSAEKERDEAKVAVESAIASGKQNEAQLVELKKKESDREKSFYKAGIQGRILAVNSGWNFAVLSVGDKQGVMVNQTLLVVRGNQPLARLRITSVEPSTSIADVLPGTVVKGTSVQPGDTVIFEGARNSASQPGLPGKGASGGGSAAPSNSNSVLPPLPNS